MSIDSGFCAANMTPDIPSVDFIKLQHALGGVYIWELVVGINYDWKLLRHKQQHAASLWAKWVSTFE